MTMKMPSKENQKLHHDKFRELVAVLPLLAAEAGVAEASCGFCLKVESTSTLNCVILTDGSGWAWTWLCRECFPALKEADGVNVQRVCRFKMQEVNGILRNAAKMVDGAILKRNNYEPFIRRPTYVESQKVAKAGNSIASGDAILVTQVDETHIGRQLLQMDFPWRDDYEWMLDAAGAFSSHGKGTIR